MRGNGKEEELLWEFSHRTGILSHYFLQQCNWETAKGYFACCTLCNNSHKKSLQEIIIIISIVTLSQDLDR